MMNKEILKKILLEGHQVIRESEIMERPMEFSVSMNYVLVGIRRAGKSCMLLQDIRHRLSSGEKVLFDILFVNFEDERLLGMTASDLDMLLECHGELFGVTKPLIYLDEIQIIPGWEKFVRRLADQHFRVMVTGSNAKMLSSEIATVLGGRFVMREIFPFSFCEYLTYHKAFPVLNWEYNREERCRLARTFQDYFHFGGLAETFFLKNKREWLNGLYQKILLGDIANRNKLRNTNSLRLLARKLGESVMQPTTLARLVHILNSIGEKIGQPSLTALLHLMRDSYLVFSLPNFTSSLTLRETIRKHYFYDNGILSVLLADDDEKLLENLCAIHLHRCYSHPGEPGVFYFQERTEVDFYVPKEKWAVQASLTISDDGTRQRELEALTELHRTHPLQKAEIVTRDESGSYVIDDLTVTVIPIWEWLLRNMG